VANALSLARRIDGSLDATEWSGETGRGFVRVDRPAFAEAQTEFYIGHDREALYIAVRAFEPRMDTMLARTTAGEEELQGEESIEILLHPAGAPPVRLVVNALGARYESLNGNAAWQGAWEAATRLLADEWSVEVRIPFDTLGVRPSQGDRWGLNVIRNRRNVRSEQSAWAIGEGHRGATAASGVLAFN